LPIGGAKVVSVLPSNTGIDREAIELEDALGRLRQGLVTALGHDAARGEDDLAGVWTGLRVSEASRSGPAQGTWSFVSGGFEGEARVDAGAEVPTSRDHEVVALDVGARRRSMKGAISVVLVRT
jgi:hypothetical protein